MHSSIPSASEKGLDNITINAFTELSWVQILAWWAQLLTLSTFEALARSLAKVLGPSRADSVWDYAHFLPIYVTDIVSFSRLSCDFNFFGLSLGPQSGLNIASVKIIDHRLVYTLARVARVQALPLRAHHHALDRRDTFADLVIPIVVRSASYPACAHFVTVLVTNPWPDDASLSGGGEQG